MVRMIHVVVSCTDLKHLPARADHQLRDVEDAEPEDRARSWWARLEASGTERCGAKNLYMGAHWVAAREIPNALSQTHRAHCWVASAGYGLVSWDAMLVPYSATFTRGKADSVVRSLHEGTSFSSVTRRWWDTLTAFPGPVPGEPRSIQAVAAANPLAGILVVASPPYVEAMTEDLVEACRLLCGPEHLVIISNEAKLTRNPMFGHVVPVDSRARSIVGANHNSLNARVALALMHRLGAASFDVPTLRKLYEDMIGDTAAPVRRKGAPMTADEILAFIGMELTAAPGIGYTTLLRKLRKSGRACEQERFRDLYRCVTERLAATSGSRTACRAPTARAGA